MLRRTQPVFVVGVGSQRAGSTLLAAGLQYASDVSVHPLKELHYFDTLHGVRDIGFLTGHIQRMTAADATRPRRVALRSFFGESSASPSAGQRRSEKRRLRTRARSLRLLGNCRTTADLARVDYRELFRPMLRTAPAVADFTPEYMALPESGIRDLRAAIGPDARILLQTRDPVARLLSAYILRELGWGHARTAAEVEEAGLFRILEQGCQWLDLQAKFTDYEGARRRFDASFGNVHTCRMEPLVAGSVRELRELADFLPTDFDPDRFRSLLHTRVNSFGERTFSRALVRQVEAWVATVGSSAAPAAPVVQPAASRSKVDAAAA